MSELTDSLVGQCLDNNPNLRDAYHHDASAYDQVNMLRTILETTEQAMEREHIPAEVRKRVLETIVYGDPRAAAAMRRERELMLARFDPSEFGYPTSPVFTEPKED